MSKIGQENLALTSDDMGEPQYPEVLDDARNESLSELLDEYWDRIKKGEELITTIQADIKKRIQALYADN